MFGLNTERDNQLDAVCDKVVKEDEGMDANPTTSQAEKKTMKKMNAPSSKVVLAHQRPPPTLVAPKAIVVMAHVSRRATPKKQQPLSTIERLRALSETDSDDDQALVYRKRKVAHPSYETITP